MFGLIKILIQLFICAICLIRHIKTEISPMINDIEIINMPGKIYLNETAIADFIEDSKDIGKANDLRDDYLEKYNTKKSEKIQLRIMNGNDVENWEKKNLRWFAQIINFKDQILCGGFSIHENFIVTAKHCVIEIENLSVEVLQVRIDSISLFKGPLIRITKVIFHPSEDIALLKTKESIDEDKTISLAERSEIYEEVCRFYGFGASGSDSGEPIIPSIMQKTKVRVLKYRFTNKQTKHMFATDGLVEEGDSGSALVWKEKGLDVVGGLAKGKSQLPDGTRVVLFLRISDFRHWIMKQINIYKHGEL